MNLSRQIHEYIKDWKDSDSPQVQYQNVQNYLQRFGQRTSLMRDDLDRAGEDSSQFDGIMFHFQGSYKEVRLIADSIENLAEKLPDQSDN